MSYTVIYLVYICDWTAKWPQIDCFSVNRIVLSILLYMNKKETQNTQVGMPQILPNKVWFLIYFENFGIKKWVTGIWEYILAIQSNMVSAKKWLHWLSMHLKGLN